ncbi:S-methyl-5-thioribose-1-phosphate isomerase [candidate division WOR-3 bacterium]|nr:S-methyl-5-thioribose-1-phosphate isomerase [candidate division WOR-3 bacterium]
MKLNFSTIEWKDVPVSPVGSQGGPASPSQCGKVRILDQTMLPSKLVYKHIETPLAMAESIKSLIVRGAPLIGVAAAYGVALAGYNSEALNYGEFKKDIKMAITTLRSTRPTAYNLFSALNRMEKIIETAHEISLLKSLLLKEAHHIKKEDEQICQKIGENGLSLIPNKARILTHCNAGALATAGIGTALAPIYLAKEKGKNLEVFVPETRPALQGARLTAWELSQAGIPVTLICDSARGTVIKNKDINLCIVGADRIAKNGDIANKIGTYTLAVLAKTHNIPFYVAAPSTTFDPIIKSGNKIPIEERNPDEIKKISNREIALKDVKVFNPVFDVTPYEYITGFITENGIQKPPF